MSGEDSVRVAVVDDQRLFARGLAGIVDEQPDMKVVGQAHDGEEALAMCQKEEPDVVLMDERGGVASTNSLRNLNGAACGVHKPQIKTSRNCERGEHVQHRFTGSSPEASPAGDIGTRAWLGPDAATQEPTVSGPMGLGEGEEG